MNYNHFDYVPSTINSNRSIFRYNKPVATCGYLGFLYPLCKPERMLPGSTLDLSLFGNVKSLPLIKPLFDELYADFFAFVVPNRIVWTHWKQFLGAVDDVLFNNLTEYTIPSIKYGISGSNYADNNNSDLDDSQWTNSLACHFDLPRPDTYLNGEPPADYCPSISVLPFRGYTFIWNEFFRPEFIQPQVISVSDNGMSGMNMNMSIDVTPVGSGMWEYPVPNVCNVSDVATLGGACLPVYRAHRDLHTSCLPKPSLETLNLLAGLQAPVGALKSDLASSGQSIVGFTNPAYSALPAGFNQFGIYQSAGSNTQISNAKVYADLDQAVLTVNNYRETIMLQNYYDTLNRAGSRYDELLYNLFHCRTANSVTQIPELIIHKRFTIYRNQVTALASGTYEPLGAQASNIDTIVKDHFFKVSTTEHSYVHMLWCIRPAFIRHSDGIEPEWEQLDKFSQYYQQFDGMGDVARRQREIAYTHKQTFASQNTTFGYQEYGAEYKYQKATAQSFLDPNSQSPIYGYCIVPKYDRVNVAGVSGRPVLDDAYISCRPELFAFSKCLKFEDPTVSPQFILDLRLVGTITHPMPVYNVPGKGELL